jgi:uncharacterized membrane protein
MNFPDGLFPETWQWAAWLLLLPVVWRVAAGTPWRRIGAGGASHVWFGAIVVLSLLWSMKAGVRPGLTLHLLGATALTLMFGFRLAFLGMLAVLAATSLNGAAGWAAYGLNAVLTALLPCAVAWAVLRLVERVLPGNIFVYLFAGAFANAALVLAATALAATAALWAAAVYDGRMLLDDYLPYFLLVGFSEAWLTGAFITIFVVYLPGWVGTFDDARYLRRS